MKNVPFEQLNFALSAYNDANRQSNSLWTAVALFALVSISAYVGTDTKVLDLDFGNLILPISLGLLAGANIAYCVAHVSAYRIAAVYHSLIEEQFDCNTPLTTKFSWFDLAHRAPVSNFNRVYPLFVPLERAFGVKFYRAFKFVFDILFCGFPALVLVLLLNQVVVTKELGVAVWGISILSVLATLLLCLQIFATHLLKDGVSRVNLTCKTDIRENIMPAQENIDEADWNVAQFYYQSMRDEMLQHIQHRRFLETSGIALLGAFLVAFATNAGFQSAVPPWAVVGVTETLFGLYAFRSYTTQTKIKAHMIYLKNIEASAPKKKLIGPQQFLESSSPDGRRAHLEPATVLIFWLVVCLIPLGLYAAMYCV